MIKHTLFISIAFAAFIISTARAEKLVINSNESDPAPKHMFTKVVDEFKWDVYYRKDLFEKYGISVPKTSEEFIAAGKKLKS